MFETSHIQLSESALRNNFRFLKSVVGETEVSSVVKGNAYGHGLPEFVETAEKCGQNHFSVFSTNEALAVKTAAKNNPIVMVMGETSGKGLDWCVQQGVEFFVFDLYRLREAVNAAKRCGNQAIIHIELETGMHRTGFDKSKLNALIKYVGENREYLHLKGLCTHLAGAESIANYVRVRNQIKTFHTLRRHLKTKGVEFEMLHMACSAAALRYPETRLDLVRIGILQYGFWPSRETFIDYCAKRKEPLEPLERIISWRSKVMDVKKVATGDFIGYGTTYLAQRDMKIATVPVGYSHGFARSLSNTGRVLVNNHRVSVVGLVNMNAMMIDITDAGEINSGDEVILIGKQGDLEITVSSFSELSDQLNYELLTRLPADIPRIITA
jgi:alanine racemase